MILKANGVRRIQSGGCKVSIAAIAQLLCFASCSLNEYELFDQLDNIIERKSPFRKGKNSI